MRIKLSSLMGGLLLSFSFSGNAFSEDLVSQVQSGCATEIKNYCSQVASGEGRMLACFYAHEDKLSGSCQYALYDAAAQLEHAVSSLNYVAGQCEEDIVKHCASVQLGEGRILECLESNAESISSKCTQALGDVFE